MQEKEKSETGPGKGPPALCFDSEKGNDRFIRIAHFGLVKVP
jgi:hypothetical protein